MRKSIPLPVDPPNEEIVFGVGEGSAAARINNIIDRYAALVHSQRVRVVEQFSSDELNTLAIAVKPLTHSRIKMHALRGRLLTNLVAEPALSTRIREISVIDLIVLIEWTENRAIELRSSANGDR